MRASGYLAVMVAVVLVVPAAVRAGQTVCPCIADNSIASYSTEVQQNRGGTAP